MTIEFSDTFFVLEDLNELNDEITDENGELRKKFELEVTPIEGVQNEE